LPVEAREAGEVLARFFFARFRCHSLSRFLISSCDTESKVRTTLSNFSDADSVNVFPQLLFHHLIQIKWLTRFMIVGNPFELAFRGVGYVCQTPACVVQHSPLFPQRIIQPWYFVLEIQNLPNLVNSRVRRLYWIAFLFVNACKGEHVFSRVGISLF
jgi:hypothetical protein